MFDRRRKFFARSLTLLAALFCLGAVQVKADGVIFETAPAGPPGQESGTFIDSDQYLGARFQVSVATQITAVGGHLGGNPQNGSIFAAIVSLPDATAFPDGNPFDFTPLASKEFVVPFPSADILTDFDLLIGPGHYALIFGSGRFGATGDGFLTINNNLLSENNFFSFGNTWLNDPLMGSRFVVVGNPAAAVPEPATMLLLGTGLAGLGAAARRKRRQGKGD